MSPQSRTRLHALKRPVHREESRADKKRQKFNEPLRNSHIHGMIDVPKKLEVTSRNAARYGLDIDDLESLLESLDMADEAI